jgi:hypothetical protein
VAKSREQQVLVLSMHIPGILMIPLKMRQGGFFNDQNIVSDWQ